METLSQQQIDQFIDAGYVKIEQAFSREIADRCRTQLWQAIGLEPDEPATWTQPVIRVGEMGAEPFRESANTPRLHSAFRQLLGDNWLPRDTIGSFPIRFPVADPAGDTGWHVDASFPGNDPLNYLDWRINVHSQGRALLMLFLFSDVTEQDAPTRIRERSHIDVARLLAPMGETGLSLMELAQRLDSLPERKTVTATGSAGTVYLCHPFLVHAAQDHRGQTPKFMAQPPLFSKQAFTLNPPETSCYPMEQAILRAIHS